MLSNPMEEPESVVVSSFFSGKAVSLYPNENHQCPEEPAYDNVAETFLFLIDELNIKLKNMPIPPPVAAVYNPTIYARYTFEMYAKTYCNTKKSVMFFGMNPGPWGMSQTGVPFGEVSLVRDWLKIFGPVGKPEQEIKPRPVTGFECTRTEVSGKRFWGFLKGLCGTPEVFFRTSFIYNYLPQQWLKANGCNVTPSDFRSNEMKCLYDVCDPMFAKVVQLYGVETIVAVGKFCEARANKALKKYLPNNTIKILYLPHPSPRTVNNNHWEQKALQYFKDLDLLRFYQCDNSSTYSEKT